MPFRDSKNPADWQNAYTREDGWEDSTRYRGRFFLPLALCFLALFIYSFLHIIPFLENFAEKYPPAWSIVVVFLAALLLFLLFVNLTTSPAKRLAARFFEEFYVPPENISPLQIINYRLFGVPSLPPPLNLLFPFKYVIARDGDIANRDAWPAWMAFNLGGPLTLIVFDGHALYLERGNRFSRVVGPGAPFLEWHERIKYAVDMRPKVRTGDFDVWTKDGIKIKVTAQINCQIGSPDSISPDLTYPYDPEAVKKAVERFSVRWMNRNEDPNPSDFTWLDAAWGQVTGIAPGYIGSRMLDDVFIAERRSGQILSPDSMQELLTRIDDATWRFGVRTTSFQILNCELPKDVEDCRKEYWGAAKKAIEIVREGQAKANHIRAVEKARADAQRDLIVSIIQQLGKCAPDERENALLLFFDAMLDSALSDPLMRAYLADEALETLDKIRAILQEKK